MASNVERPRFTIGVGDWVREMRAYTDAFDSRFWDDFRPCSIDAIDDCERTIRRRLPSEFRDFLARVGAGNFGRGGGVYTPEEIVLACSGPLFSLLGSSSWATDEEHRRLFASRGLENPRPDLFTPDAMTFDGVDLFDILQVGHNGNGCYRLIHVGPEPRPFGYCLLDPYGSLEDPRPTFSDGLIDALVQDRQAAEGPVPQPGLGMDMVERLIREADRKWPKDGRGGGRK